MGKVIEEYMQVEVLIRLKYELPKNPTFRHDIYGTTDPEKCVKIDFETDPAAMLVESDDLEVVSVHVP